MMEQLTMHPRAHLMKVKTLAASGAEPVIINLNRPPMFFCKPLKTNLSHILLFRIIPLKHECRVK